MTKAPLRALVLLVCLVAAPGIAAAPTPDDLKEARAHYNRGIDSVGRREYRAAATELERAYQLAPTYKILYNIGLAYDELGSYPAALRALERYLAEGASLAPAQQKAEAERRVAVLRARVGRVDVRRAAGATIAIDGAVVGTTPLAEPLVVVAGEHEIVATAEGVAPVRKVIDVAGGATVTLDLEPPAPAVITTIDDAEAALARGDHEAARAAAAAIVERGHLAYADVVRAYQVLARGAAAVDCEAEARDAFVELLASAPEYAPPPAGDPRAQKALAQARDFWSTQPTLPGVEASAAFVSGSATLRIVVRDPSRIVRRLRLGHRFRASDPFATRDAPPVGALVTLGAAPVGTSGVEYFVLGLDARDSERFHAGTAAVPRREPRPPDDAAVARPFFARPVVWIGAAVIVAGGLVAVYAATRAGDDPGPPSQAAFTPGLQCGAGSPCN